MNRFVAFLTALRRSRAERDSRRVGMSVLPAWHLGSAHFTPVHR